MNKVSDETIVQKVTRQLSNRGMQSPCHIAVAARKGDVTLSGTIQFEYQRIAALHAARGIDGVRRVMDHLQVQDKVVQKTITVQRPITEKTAPADKEKTAPVDKEKTAPADADPITSKVGNRDVPSNPA
ncbi:MAG: BON domain-containing protein [Thermoguttaceae bacterium]|jgi:hypothetical protein